MYLLATIHSVPVTDKRRDNGVQYDRLKSTPIFIFSKSYRL